MDFTASNGGEGGSYEKPKPGTYTGVLIGIADIGTQDSGKYGPKRKVMLRWELHKRKGPSLDAGGNILTITSRYNQSFDVKSTLRAVIEAHAGPIKDGDKVNSRNWLGLSAKLFLVESEDGKYVNVDKVAPLDPEEDEKPRQIEQNQHWEPTDTTAPPNWAKNAVEKSTEWGRTHGSSANGTAVAVGAGVGSDDDENKIPF